MILLIVFLTGICVALGFSLLAAYSDLRHMLIENFYSLAIGLSFFVVYGAVYAAGKADIFAPLWVHILSGVMIFLMTFAMFAFGVLGGADSKLATAVAFWIGIKGLPIFLVTMTMIGGLLGIGALLLSRYQVLPGASQGSWVARAQGGEKNVPYAVAIAGGTFAAFFQLGYLNLQAFSLFLT